MKSGIYQIKINNSFYIGSSRNIQRRYWEHLWKLKNKKHPNIHLQYLYNKYGEEKFELSILENCTINCLIEKEQYWINLLNPNINKAPVAGSTLGLKLTNEQCENRRIINTGRKHSLETIKKRTDKIKGRKYTEKHKENISKSMLGKKQNQQTIKKRVEKNKKPVACYDLNYILIRIYDSAKTAALENNYQATNITRCCKNKIKTYKNKIWRYLDG